MSQRSSSLCSESNFISEDCFKCFISLFYSNQKELSAKDDEIIASITDGNGSVSLEAPDFLVKQLIFIRSIRLLVNLDTLAEFKDLLLFLQQLLVHTEDIAKDLKMDVKEPLDLVIHSEISKEAISLCSSPADKYPHIIIVVNIISFEYVLPKDWYKHMICFGKPDKKTYLQYCFSSVTSSKLLEIICQEQIKDNTKFNLSVCNWYYLISATRFDANQLKQYPITYGYDSSIGELTGLKYCGNGTVRIVIHIRDIVQYLQWKKNRFMRKYGSYELVFTSQASMKFCSDCKIASPFTHKHESSK